MKRYFVLAVVALGLFFTACDEEENLNSSVWIGSESESNVIAQLDTLYLDARIENLSGAMRYLWTVDGKEVSTASTYKFSQPKTGEYVIGLAVSDDKGENLQTTMTAKGEGRFGKGAFILNEGNMGNETGTLTFVEGTKGALKNRMAVVGDKAFVMGNKQLFVIQNGTVIHIISFESALSGVAKTYDGNLWVSCTKPASIIKVSPVDYKTIDSHTLNVSIGAGWGVAPAFSAKDDIIYFSNAGFKLYRHVFSQNETEEVADIKEYVEDAGIYYNSLGVDPVSGEVYFATLKGYADYKTNDIAIFDFNKTPALQFDIKNKNSFPAGVFFTENFK